MDKIIELDYHTKPIIFHVYSQTNIEDLNVFKKYDNININITDDLKQIFSNFVESDILIISDSGLSIQAALINDGIIFTPVSYNINNWIYSNCCGEFNVEKYNELIQNLKY
jgi:hypothetical protein